MTEFKFGEGKLSGVIAVVMGLMSLGGVLCFHFWPRFWVVQLFQQVSMFNNQTT